MDRRELNLILVAVAGLAVAAPAVLGLVRAGTGLASTNAVIDGVPTEILRPAAVTEAAPAVVIAHGYAGSSVLMEPLGRAFARAGYVVALPDFTGHGQNPAGGPTPAALDRDLAAVVGWLSEQESVDPGRVSLVGHSMGAAAVVRYATAHPDQIRSTVAISLPAAIEGTPPPQLLLLVGQFEQPSFKKAAEAELAQAPPGAQASLVVVPWAEHLTIVWSQIAADAELAWVGTAVGGPTGPAILDPAWLWFLLLLLGGTLLAIPLARVVYGRQTRPAPLDALPGWQTILICLAAVVGAALVARLTASFLDPYVPVALAAYLAIFLTTAALISALLATWLRRRTWAMAVPDPTLRSVGATFAMTAYAVTLIVLSSRWTWADLDLLAGPRPWVAAGLSVLFLAYQWTDEALVARVRPGLRLGLVAVNRVLLAGALVGSVFLLGAPLILLLVVPVMVLLFVVLSVFGAIGAFRVRDRFAPALVQAVPLAVIIATGFPLTG